MARRIVLMAADSREILAQFDEQSLGEFRIGRDPQANQLFLNDRGISRQHARIFVQSRRLLVEDCGSSGGTYLNERELRKPHALADGSQLRVGGITITVRIEGDPDGLPDTLVKHDGDPRASNPGAAATVVVVGKGPAIPAPALPSDFEVELGRGMLLLGRDDTCDVQLDSPVVSRLHSRIKPSGNGWAISDEGSQNGTFVNGERTNGWRRLTDGDVIGIGPYRLQFDGQRLVRQELSPGARIEVSELGKEVVDHETKKPRRLLQKVSLVIKPGEFVGLMGPVGCGKSTFMSMINGRELGAGNMVYYDNEDLFANIDALKAGVSYIPQQVDPSQVIIHQDLPVAEALRFTSRLRLPPDTSREEIEANISRVLETVRLEHRRNVQIKNLSGGQRKKVAVAMELLSRPRVLLADEVTAGMDMGNEQQTMELFRKLANEGMTVVCITHYVDRLKMCDNIACFSGGWLVFYGPPQQLPGHFGAEDIGDVYPVLDAKPPEELAVSFGKTQIYDEYVGARRTRPDKRRGGATRRPPIFSVDARARQWRVLTDRYCRLVRLDPSGVLLLLGVVPLVAWMLCILARSIGAPDHPGNPLEWAKTAAQQDLLCFGAPITIMFLGLFGAVREIVKEISIYRHERFSNLLIGPYLMSKAVPLSILSGVHALLMTWVLWQWGGLDAHPVWRVFLVVWLSGICGTMLGLLISAVARTSDQAVMSMIAAVIPQILFAGGRVPLKGFSAFIAKWFVAAYWADTALKAMLSPTTQQYIDPNAPTDGARQLPGILALLAYVIGYGLIALIVMARKDGPGGVAKNLYSLRRSLDSRQNQAV
jgi:ABC-type multidrug transport system ATPase subunit